ncbi:pilus assembly protein TadE [Mesorhizobium sp. Root552]|jgi:Flp pilus assembly protein TadG|uniref:TadE/TadG family type IV pilus assembly protein n=1 Tax=Mesorhizobium sp. Root552 TaxID=1736555 RepID=UPI0007001054|nr:TadE/TadG family type IV pilus assembly protein [Mesorhizobium sp. Root552]KQZ16326.1 pilus assembly protein TadE [Mesorhizobium sp. Root552]
MGSVSSIVDSRSSTRRSGLLARFRRDREGSVAVEFTMLAIPFSMLVFAVLETCISFAGQEVLANATDDIARQMRTGQIRTINETDLRNLVCSRLEIIVTSGCPGLKIDLRTLTSFNEGTKHSFMIDKGSNQVTLLYAGGNTAFTTQLGEAGTKNMLRVFYKWPVITDFMSKYISNMSDGTTLHFATMTWQNEPF